MEINVRFSGGLAQELGAPRLTVSLAEGATAADLLAHLRQQYPQAGSLAIALAVVAGQYVGEDRRLEAGQEVALLLPVAGG